MHSESGRTATRMGSDAWLAHSTRPSPSGLRGHLGDAALKGQQRRARESLPEVAPLRPSQPDGLTMVITKTVVVSTVHDWCIAQPDDRREHRGAAAALWSRRTQPLSGPLLACRAALRLADGERRAHARPRFTFGWLVVRRVIARNSRRWHSARGAPLPAAEAFE
jgi:hypothetical protein